MTTAAKEFWTSAAAQNFPDSLEIHGDQWPLTEQGFFYPRLFKRLVQSGWIPTDGTILELGAGASSGLLFPPKIGETRLIATDISQLLLNRNPVPQTNKFVLDAGNDIYPGEWHEQFTLVFALQLSRYLDLNEKIHLATQAREVLAPEGRILLVDTRALHDREIAAIVGEVGPFLTDQESAILQGAGFKEIRYGTYCVEVVDMFQGRTGAYVDYVTARKSNSSTPPS